MDKIQVTMTVEQARAVSKALDVYTRLCIGQVDVVASLFVEGVIPVSAHPIGEPRGVATLDQVEAVIRHVTSIKEVIGFGRCCNLGIGHPHVQIAGRRAYEVNKVLAQVLAEARNPSPPFRGVDYEGLIVRYTDDPAPEASLVAGDKPAEQEENW